MCMETTVKTPSFSSSIATCTLEKPSLREIFQLFAGAYEYRYKVKHRRGLPDHLQKVIRNIQNCGTNNMDSVEGHCNSCDHKVHWNKSCLDRHCPRCGGNEREKWVKDQINSILPTDYLFITFKPPDIDFRFANLNKEIIHDILFETGPKLLIAMLTEKGITPAMWSALHTWSGNLFYKPHIHCLMTAGGLSDDRNRWIEINKELEGIENRFRDMFIKLLRQSMRRGYSQEGQNHKNISSLGTRNPRAIGINYVMSFRGGDGKFMLTG